MPNWGGGGVSDGSKMPNFYFGKVFFQLACRISKLASWRAWHLEQACLASNWCVLKPDRVLEAKRLGDTEELLENTLANIESPAHDILPQVVTHKARLPVVAVHHANDELHHVRANTIHDDKLDLPKTSEQGDFQCKEEAVDVVMVALLIHQNCICL